MRIGGEKYSTPKAQGNRISAHYSTDSTTKTIWYLQPRNSRQNKTHPAFRKKITSGIRANATLTHLESLTPCFYMP